MSTATLSQNELEVLRILWDQKELKPSEIQQTFSWPIENATLRSTLVNLIEKGHVTRAQEGKAFRYAARIPKATFLQATIRNLARVFAGGSTHELVAQLVETGDLQAEDLQLIREIATQRSTKTKKKKTP